MASSPPDGSILPEGWTWSDVGHAALDVAGLIPVIGEPADLANAAWLAHEGNYLDAGLSLISMVPVVGDAIGKGGKVLKKAGGKLAGPALDALKKMDFEKTLGRFRNHPELKGNINKIIDELKKWRDQLTGGPAAKSSPTGTMFCPLVTKQLSSLGERLAKASGAEAEKIAQDIAQLSTHKAAGVDRVVLGKHPGYISEANKGGTWYEVPENFYNDLVRSTGSAYEAREKIWLVNKAFLEQQMKTGKSIEFTKEGIDWASENINSATRKELDFMREKAAAAGYVEKSPGYFEKIK